MTTMSGQLRGPCGVCCRQGQAQRSGADPSSHGSAFIFSVMEPLCCLKYAALWTTSSMMRVFKSKTWNQEGTSFPSSSRSPRYPARLTPVYVIP